MKCEHYFNAFELSMLFSYFLYELVGRIVAVWLRFLSYICYMDRSGYLLGDWQGLTS